MGLLPESPRKRRRLLFVAAAVIVAGGIAGGIAAVPNTTPGSGAPTVDEGPAQLATSTSVKLARNDRHAIDALLAKFVPAAVKRQSPTLAWSLAGPELKTSTSLAAWKKGNSPVPYYPVKEKTFTGWPTIDVEKDAVVLSLLVHPTKGHEDLGDYTFAIEAIRSHRHWLVNRLYTIAINRKPKGGTREFGPADVGAQAQGGPPPTKQPSLSTNWFLPVLFGLVAALAAPFLIGGFLFVRSRRRRRRLATGEFPMLPTRR